MKRKYVLDSLHLAMLANGGEKFREDYCHCDPSVGAVPCEYCAVYNGLRYAYRYIEKGSIPRLVKLNRR